MMAILTLWSCKEENEKYQPPEWQAGKIGTQIAEYEDLTIFQECLKKAGYHEILNTSGSYTVFAPNNSAFETFFQKNPEYKAQLESEEESDLINALVEFHLLYNSWSKDQFQNLDITGWVDPKNELSEPRAYKRKTLYRPANKSYPAKRRGNLFQVVQPEEAVTSKIAYTQSTKYAPIFFDEFFDLYNLTLSDYEFYFNRTYESGKLYFCNAAINEPIRAENGLIYKTDRVIEPLLSGEEFLSGQSGNHSYDMFLDLINEFSEFRLNFDATFEQTGAEEGEDIDSLYNLGYPELVFNVHSEITGNASNERNTYLEHHGLMAPTDEALETFINQYLSGSGGLEGMPRGTKEIIVNSHMSEGAIYPSEFNSGFLNGEGDVVNLDEDNIIQKSFGSNCTFLGLKKAVVPRILKSICKPLYISNLYRKMMYATELTRTVEALKKTGKDYSFFLPTDKGTGDQGDSSFYRLVTNADLNRYHFEAWDLDAKKFERIPNNDLRKRILNQVGESVPTGIANKEFIRNLGGNYIIFNNENGTVRGSSPTIFGYNGDSIINLKPRPIYQNETDNGQVYEVNSWFSFLIGSSYYGFLIKQSPEFLNLLTKAGLFDETYFDFPFLVDGQFYTAFIPSDEAIKNYGLDTLPKQELRDILKYHFVKGNLLFTDGKAEDGLYPTLRMDESSTEFINRNSQLNIIFKPDLIEILDKNGNVYLKIPENENKTNRMVTYDTDDESLSDWDYITTGVIHRIDKVLIKDSLQVNQIN